MSTDNATPIRSVNTEPLQLAASLLRVGVSAFGEHAEPWGDTSLDDVLQLVCTANASIEEWLRATSGEDASHAFDALDVLTLVETVLDAGLQGANWHTISPVRGAMKIAAELLERAIAVQQTEPDATDSEEHKEDAEISEAA
ncbi:MAG: hypothetical protein JWP44_4894 [Mucilaginibacter sp.]|nr:hypothetical protein [Mucilaginibacter sp.]